MIYCMICHRAEVRCLPNGRRNNPVQIADVGKRKGVDKFVCSTCIAKVRKDKALPWDGIKPPSDAPTFTFTRTR